jgi:hypothetical protein
MLPFEGTVPAGSTGPVLRRSSARRRSNIRPGQGNSVAYFMDIAGGN